MKKNQYSPTIFGTLCEGECRVDRGLARALERATSPSVLLPFAVERRHLKNVVLTMKLMDIAGLVVADGHRRHIVRHLPKLDRSAKEAGIVDTVARRGRTFVGYCTEEMALAEWRSEAGEKAERRGKPPARKIAQRAREIRVELLTEATKNN